MLLLLLLLFLNKYIICSVFLAFVFETHHGSHFYRKLQKVKLVTLTSAEKGLEYVRRIPKSPSPFNTPIKRRNLCRLRGGMLLWILLWLWFYDLHLITISGGIFYLKIPYVLSDRRLPVVNVRPKWPLSATYFSANFHDKKNQLKRWKLKK